MRLYLYIYLDTEKNPKFGILLMYLDGIWVLTGREACSDGSDSLCYLQGSTGQFPEQCNFAELE